MSNEETWMFIAIAFMIASYVLTTIGFFRLSIFPLLFMSGCGIGLMANQMINGG